MPPLDAVEILKEAILLERHGRAFYQKVAQQASQKEVREFFQAMADEETKHMEVLSRQMKTLLDSGKFTAGPAPAEATFSARVITPALVSQLEKAEFESAAVAAAMLMEKQAIELYRHRQQQAGDPAEKDLYRWLGDWEEGHLELLARLDQEIRQAIWNQMGFEPF